jgi:AraC family transcriptional regulator
MHSSIRRAWVEVDLGALLRNGAAIAAHAGSRSAGLQVEVRHAGPGELPEGHVPAHVVVLNLQRAIRTDTWWVGDRRRGELSVPPNATSVFPADAPFVTRWLDPVDDVMVEIAPRLLGALVGEDGAARPQLRPELAGDDPLLAHLVLGLAELARRDEPPGSLHEQTLGAALSAHLLRRYGRAHWSDGLRNGGLSAVQLGRITAYVEDHLGEAMTLQELAGVSAMSVFHLARSFKARTGVAPHQYVLRRRLDRAKELLRGTDLPVGEVAMRCGFAHPSHFTSTFQRVLGTTPSRYRRLATGAC